MKSKNCAKDEGDKSSNDDLWVRVHSQDDPADHDAQRDEDAQHPHYDLQGHSHPVVLESLDEVAFGDFVEDPVGHDGHGGVARGHAGVTLASDDPSVDNIRSPSVVDGLEHHRSNERQEVQRDNVQHVGNLPVEQNVQVEVDHYPVHAPGGEEVAKFLQPHATSTLQQDGQVRAAHSECSIIDQINDKEY